MVSLPFGVAKAIIGMKTANVTEDRAEEKAGTKNATTSKTGGKYSRFLNEPVFNVPLFMRGQPAHQ